MRRSLAEGEAPVRAQGDDEEPPLAPGERLQRVDERLVARAQPEEPDVEAFAVALDDARRRP